MIIKNKKIKLINLITGTSFLTLPLISISAEGSPQVSKTKIDLGITAKSFEIKGSIGKAKITLRRGQSIPREIKFHRIYNVNFETNPRSFRWQRLIKDDNYFSEQNNNFYNLSNDHVVVIRLQIRDQYRNKYTFVRRGTNYVYKDITLRVSGLKKAVKTNYLTASSFKTSGASGSATITKKDEISIPSQVKITYAKEKTNGEKPLSPRDYSDRAPISLSYGDKVYINFAIKRDDIYTYKLPDNFKNPVVFTVSGPKTEIDTSKLILNSFETIGHNGSGALAIKNSISLPSEVEVVYAVSYGTEPQTADYSSAPPSELLNGGSVYIKFAIKSKHALTHEFPAGFTDTIVFPVKKLPKKDIVVSKLKASSFEVLGSNGDGSLSINADLPPQVAMTYASSPLSDPDPNSLSFSSEMPSLLSNGNKVYIKFAIKRGDASTHKLPDDFTDNPIFFTVSGLKTEVKTTDLIADSFETSGTHGSGTITIKTSAKIPEQLEITYAKELENKAPSSEDYSETAPRTLSNEDKVYINFAIKGEDISTHKLPNNFKNPVVFTVSGLKMAVKTNYLTASSFKTSGASGSATITKKDEISFPSQVQITYAKEKTNGEKPLWPRDYSNRAPISLSYGDKVYINFAIKGEDISTHKLPDNFQNPVVFTVSRPKTEIDTSKLILNSFETIGHNGSGTLAIKNGISLPSKVEVAYAVSYGAEPQTADYSSAPPPKLLNGQSVYIKFAVKSKHALTHEFPAGFTDTIVFPIKKLPKKDIVVSKLKASSFEVLGSNGAGSLSINADLPPQVEVEYATSNSPDDDPNTLSFSSTLPAASLSNGDYVYIKFAIKDTFTSTHAFPSSFSTNPIVYAVSGLKTEVQTTNLVSSSFETNGNNGSGTLAIKSMFPLPLQVEAKYAASKLRVIDTSSLSFSSTLPAASLSNGDYVYIKFAIKEDFTSTHAFPSSFSTNPIVYAVSGLKTEVQTTNLVSSSFETNGNNGSGTLAIKSMFPLPLQVEAKYAASKLRVIDTSSLSFSSTLPAASLSNGDYVYIKFAIKEDFTSTHAFPSSFSTNPIVYAVSGLKTEVQTTNLVSSSFETNGNNGSGTLAIKSMFPLPLQVEAKYAASKLRVIDTSSLSFSSTLPAASLSNGDYVYIKFAIKEDFTSTHAFPSSFSTNPIVYAVSGLKTEVQTTNLVSSSFETNGNNGSGTLAIKSMFPLPLQVEAKYAASKLRVIDTSSLSFSSTLPAASLSNGDYVYIKFAIKEDFTSTHAFPSSFSTNPIVYAVSGLKTEVQTTNLVSSSFETNGNNGSGTLAIKSMFPLPLQVEAKYAASKLRVIDTSSLSFSSTLPAASLSNGDYVYIKFAIKEDFTSTHAFPSSFSTNPIVYTVSGLKTEVETTDLTAGSFEALGNEGEGVLTKIAIIPDQVQIKYAKEIGGKVPQESEYSDSLPTSLSNDDKVYIKFAIKRGDTSTHKLPDDFTNNPVVLTVSGLKTEVETTDLTADSFETSGTHGSGTITIKTSAKIPKQLEITYAKESENKAPPLEHYSQTAPRTLSNEDKVYVKFAIKEEHQGTHKLPSNFENPIVLTTTSLNEIESPKESSESKISEKEETKTSSNKVKKQAKKTKLSKGAIAGIVIGCILGVGAIGAFVAVKFLKIDIKKLMQKMKPKK